MRAQSGYLMSQGAKKEEPAKLKGEDVNRLNAFMERVERQDRKRKDMQ